MSMRKSGVKVFAPASVSNVAVGFDSMGFALDRPGDEVIVREGSRSGLRISQITKANGKLSKEVGMNTAGVAASSLLKFLGEEKLPIDLEIHKKMGIGTGIGSSAASAVAAVMGVNEYLGRPLEKRQLLPFAVEGEQVADGVYHADNVAPSLLGGIILIRDNQTLDYMKLAVPRGLCVVIIYPKIQIFTKDARKILSDTVPFDKHIKQTANAAAFVMALFNSDFDLISRSLQDHVVEEQRKHLIPEYDRLKEMALSEGALAFNISGAGPSMFALCNNTLVMENISEKAKSIYAETKQDYEIYNSGINLEGAKLY